MSRATNAPSSRKRRRRTLRQARGFRGRRSKNIRTATEAVDRAMQMSTVHRKKKKRDYRALWMVRIGAAVRPFGLNYSRFMEGMNKSGIALNRKMLSEMAIHDPQGFERLVEMARSAVQD